MLEREKPDLEREYGYQDRDSSTFLRNIFIGRRSYIELADKAMLVYHLEKAIEHGFTNLEKIHRHDALAYLRNLAAFDDFVDNGYRRISSLPPARQDLLDRDAHQETDELLEQIIKLGELRDKGILTEQEFTRQKRKLLGEE